MGKKPKTQDKERNKKKEEKRARRVQRKSKQPEKGPLSDQRYIVQTPQNDEFLTNISPEKLDPETLAFASQFFREKDEALRQRLCALILSGQPVEAIKLYRERNKSSLQEAKDVVDALMEELGRAHPDQAQDVSP